MNDTVCQFCRVTHRLTVPTVHLNGTSAQGLLDQLQAAVEALRQAQVSVVEAAPNGRDYYLQAGASTLAMELHERRCQDLHRMRTELEEMRDHVQEVVNFQDEQRASRREVR